MVWNNRVVANETVVVACGTASPWVPRYRSQQHKARPVTLLPAPRQMSRQTEMLNNRETISLEAQRQLIHGTSISAFDKMSKKQQRQDIQAMTSSIFFGRRGVGVSEGLRMCVCGWAGVLVRIYGKGCLKRRTPLNERGWF